jgi:hypothetical protein
MPLQGILHQEFRDEFQPVLSKAMSGFRVREITEKE